MRSARFCVCAALLVAACGRRDPDGATLVIAPQSVLLAGGASQRFVVAGEGPVAWSLAEGAAAGSIARDGTYTAPPSPGTYHVIARTRAGAAVASVRVVERQVAVALSPASAEAVTGESIRFRAVVTGVGDEAVTWSASAGSIDATGLWLAPASEGTVSVEAASRADPSQKAVAVVAVTRRRVSIDPPAAALEPGARAHFNATVLGGSDTAVAWTVAEGAAGGAVDAAGFYTAPILAGTYHLIATSRADPGAAATAEIRVAHGIAVSLTPASAKLAARAQQQFVAVVSGADKRVTWSVVEGGAGGEVDAAGLYAAPPAPGVYHLRATSVADPSASAVAEIAVGAPPVTIAISPSAVTVSPGSALRFTASVAGALDTRAAWSSDCCELQGGAFTAPPVEGTWHVVAQSVADASQRATAVVTVKEGLGIDPAAVTLGAGDRIAFHAAAAAVWSVDEAAAGGSISASGVYQAPLDHGGAFHVRAEGIGTALVTVLPPDLVDHGGPLAASTRTFAVFWGDPSAWAADVRPSLEALLRGLDGSSYFALADQYLRGSRAATRFGGSFSDPSTPPATPDKADAQAVGAVACSALRAGGIAPAQGDMVFVYGAAALDPAPLFCAWHSFVTCQGVTLLVGFVPNVAGSWSCLKLGAQQGCNGQTADANATASLTAHELMEAMTDPLFSSWMDRGGDELGDKCEDRSSCVSLSTGAFQLQAEYSNQDHACVP